MTLWGVRTAPLPGFERTQGNEAGRRQDPGSGWRRQMRTCIPEERNIKAKRFPECKCWGRLEVRVHPESCRTPPAEERSEVGDKWGAPWHRSERETRSPCHRPLLGRAVPTHSSAHLAYPSAPPQQLPARCTGPGRGKRPRRARACSCRTCLALRPTAWQAVPAFPGDADVPHPHTVSSWTPGIRA